MAYQTIKNFVLRRLGYPVVKVYITEEQLDDCIWESMNRYFEFRGDDMLKEDYISGIAGQSTYTLPATIDPHNIHQIIFKPSDPLMSLTGVAQDVYLLYYLQNAGGASNFIVDYWMTLASYEEYQRVLGTQPHYTLLNGNQIKLDPVPQTGFMIGIRYMDLYDEATIESNRWMRLYALAIAKQIEGRIRSKFSSFQAGSGEVSLDGESLVQDGIREWELLITENQQKQWPLGMVMG